MARPIEATPVLKGKDALRFIQASEDPKPYTPPVFDTAKMQAAVQAAATSRASK